MWHSASNQGGHHPPDADSMLGRHLSQWPNAGPTISSHHADQEDLLRVTVEYSEHDADLIDRRSKANTMRWSNAGLMLGRRLRRRPNIKTTFCQRLMFETYIYGGFFL